MTSAYALTTGDYSDYHVLCVCDTKERAELVLAAYNEGRSTWNEVNMEEFTYVDFNPTVIPSLVLSTSISDDGTRTDDPPHTENTVDLGDGKCQRPAELTWFWYRSPVSGVNHGTLTVRGTDVERVGKVFSERAARFLADPAMAQQSHLEGV